MPNLLMQCKKCNHVFPSGISMAPGSSATFINNKTQCPHCGSMESLPDGTFEATVSGFVELLKSSKNPLQDAKEILDGLEEAKDTQDLSKVKYGDKIELILKKNKYKLYMAIAIIEILISLLSKQPDIQINNIVINSQFCDQYNQIININEE